VVDAASAWKLGSLAFKLVARASKVRDDESLATFLAVTERLQAKIERDSDQWLRSEFGSDLAKQADALAAIAALNDILSKCLPDGLSVAQADLNPERIADLVVAKAGQADASFRERTFGGRLLHCLVKRAYEEAKRDHHFAAAIHTPVQEVLLNRTDQLVTGEVSMPQQIAELKAMFGPQIAATATEYRLPREVVDQLLLTTIGLGELEQAAIPGAFDELARRFATMRDALQEQHNDDPGLDPYAAASIVLGVRRPNHEILTSQAARQAAEEKQRAETARQAAEEKQRAETARQAAEEQQRAEAAKLRYREPSVGPLGLRTLRSVGDTDKEPRRDQATKTGKHLIIAGVLVALISGILLYFGILTHLSTTTPGSAIETLLQTPATAPPQTEVATALPQTEAATALPQTEVATALPQTEAATAPPQTEAATAPPQTEAATAPPQTGAATAPSQTEAATAPSQTEATMAPPQTEAATAPPHTEAATALPHTEAATAPSQTEAATAPSQTEATMAPPLTEAATAPPHTEAATALPHTEAATAPPQTEAAMAPPRTAPTTLRRTAPTTLRRTAPTTLRRTPPSTADQLNREEILHIDHSAYRGATRHDSGVHHLAPTTP